MKYIIGASDHLELVCAPIDDDGPDHELDFIVRGVSEFAPSDDAADYGVYERVRVKASQFYEFVDWLRRWCPDPRNHRTFHLALQVTPEQAAALNEQGIYGLLGQINLASGLPDE